MDSDGDGAKDSEEFLAFSSPVDSAWTPARAKLTHRWSFTNNLTDSVASSAAGPDAHVNHPVTIYDPNGATASAAVTLGANDVLLPGGASGTTDAIQLGPNLLGGRAVPATIDVWASQASVQNYSRVFDFGSGTTDYLTFTWTRDTTLATQRTEWRDFTTNLLDIPGQPFILNSEYHIVVTFEPGVEPGGLNRVSFYAASASAADLGIPRVVQTTANNLANLTDTFNFLGRSMSAGDAVANARYNDARIWLGVDSAGRREQLHDQGPDSTDITDSDNDGLVHAWELLYFPALTTTTGIVDSDGDSFTNIQEQAGRSIPGGQVRWLPSRRTGTPTAWRTNGNL